MRHSVLVSGAVVISGLGMCLLGGVVGSVIARGDTQDDSAQLNVLSPESGGIRESIYTYTTRSVMAPLWTARRWLDEGDEWECPGESQPGPGELCGAPALVSTGTVYVGVLREARLDDQVYLDVDAVLTVPLAPGTAMIADTVRQTVYPSTPCMLALSLLGERGVWTPYYSIAETAVTDCIDGYLTSSDVRAEVDCLVSAASANEGARCHGAYVFGLLLSEQTENLNAIRTTERAYHAEWDVFTSAPWTPQAVDRGNRVQFKGGGFDEFEFLGWVPRAPVLCRYRSIARNSHSAIADDFDAEMECDLDGDGINAVYHANRADKATPKTPEGIY